MTPGTVTARRIVVYGVTGSGKSTLAPRIADALGLPYHPVDDLTWQPNWVEVPMPEQRRIIGELVARPAWVLDSIYGRWIDLVLPRTELIVALDYPRLLSLSRLMRRTVRRVVDRQEVCNGNVETWAKAFGRDSIIRWHFRSFDRKHARIAAWCDDPQVPPVQRFTRPAQAEQWLRSLG